jgi:hypothetical protein
MSTKSWWITRIRRSGRGAADDPAPSASFGGLPPALVTLLGDVVRCDRMAEWVEPEDLAPVVPMPRKLNGK